MAKGSRKNKNFKHPENSNRGKAKLNKGKGKLAMGNMSHADWTKKFDPLLNVKGMERHIKVNY